MIMIRLILAIVLLNQIDAFAISECGQDAEFKCFNNGLCMQIHLNETSSVQVCNCRPGFTGRQCTQLESPCSANPCGSNGFCNSRDVDYDELAAAATGNSGYICRCKPGFSGDKCQENVNECLNATCFNEGLCIDGINSYECECKWPTTGRYCQTRMSCSTDDICKNEGVCIEEPGRPPHCICKTGFRGIDCSTKINYCLDEPCQHGSICQSGQGDYTCQCTSGYYGKNCQHFNSCLLSASPCLNNSTCIHLNTRLPAAKRDYYCQCLPGFTGVNCDIKLCLNNCTSKSEPKKQLKEAAASPASSNGSFVLVVNIEPSEFKRRQREIISEFERRLGILMLVEKEPNTLNEMVYPYYPNGRNESNETPWTKVYFVILFACLYDSNKLEAAGGQQPHMCLQNKVNNVNDHAQILNEMKKASVLLPNYVSNISYEAYSTNRRVDQGLTDPRVHPVESTLTTVLVICLAISLLIGISLAFTVLIRQNAKKVKAPVWFPPPAPSSGHDAGDRVYETIKQQQEKNNKGNTNWSNLGKAFDEFSSFVFDGGKKKQFERSSSSPSSDSTISELYEYESKPANKMRKVETPIYSTAPHSFSKPINIRRGEVGDSPECYPSPPESLPDHHPVASMGQVNLKGGAYCITPLMVFIMGRSKLKHAQQQRFGQQAASLDFNEVDVVETFASSGADLNAQNLDGETALHLAVRFGLIDICERLLRHGADLSSYDNYGRNVLHTACGSNQYEICKLLLDHCSRQLSQQMDDKFDLVDSKSNDELGDTPLIIASRLNFNRLIQLLIEFNVSVNATDNEGRSALHWCAKVNNVKGACILIQAGANVNMQDNDERTPLTAALNELNTKEICDLLIKCDAFVSTEDEAKYNRMKTIMQSIGATTNGKSLADNYELITKLKQDNMSVVNFCSKKINTSSNEAMKTGGNKLQTQTATKRKLSETFNSEPPVARDMKNNLKKSALSAKQTQIEESPHQKSKRLPAYTPLTPSPPLPVPAYPMPAFQQTLYSTDFYNVANVSGAKWSQNYLSSFNYDNSHSNDSDNGATNLAYTNESTNYYGYHQPQHPTPHQLTHQNNLYNNSNCYNPSEHYSTAYF